MLVIAIDAVVLIVLLKIVQDEDVGFGTALLIALGAAIGINILAFGLAKVMGIPGLVVAAVVGATLLGVAVSALFGIEIKRSFLIASIFMVFHLGVSIAFEILFSL